MNQSALPTLYEYYVGDGINSGLEAPNADGFKLNGKDITVLSGSIHYFRVHPDYWRDSLRKLRAMGFNTVQTCVPWNLHEPQKDLYDFGSGDNDMSNFTDIVKFINLAHEEDLFVVLQPGPVIGVEWEFGGLPSYLLNIPDIEVRTNNDAYLKRVTKYFDHLLPLITGLQFIKGGPIIAVQVENEYGQIGKVTGEDGKIYMKYIEKLLRNHGLGESLLFTSNFPNDLYGSVDGLLQTTQFQSDPVVKLNSLKRLQPDKPLWITEYWTGWFDAWFREHEIENESVYISRLEKILNYPASVNLYMFHGGTNFGFLNGYSIMPVVSSYDYDALLTEAGDYTEKYHRTKNLVTKYDFVKTRLPDPPAETLKQSYYNASIIQQLTLQQLINNVDDKDILISDNVISMESLDINGGSGQSYGFIIYRKTDIDISKNSVLKIEGRVHDVGIVLLDGVRQTEPLTNSDQLQGFGYWETSDNMFTFQNTFSQCTLDILVENFGRMNILNSIDKFTNQKKGLWEGNILIDDIVIKGWTIIPLELKTKFLRSFSGWYNVSDLKSDTPALYRALLDVETPCDTFINMTAWGKGNVFINGFNIGRYFNAGPTHTLYVPAPVLKVGQNEILVFELYAPADQLVFSDVPILS